MEGIHETSDEYDKLQQGASSSTRDRIQVVEKYLTLSGRTTTHIKTKRKPEFTSSGFLIKKQVNLM